MLPFAGFVVAGAAFQTQVLQVLQLRDHTIVSPMNHLMVETGFNAVTADALAVNVIATGSQGTPSRRRKSH